MIVQPPTEVPVSSSLAGEPRENQLVVIQTAIAAAIAVALATISPPTSWQLHGRPPVTVAFIFGSFLFASAAFLSIVEYFDSTISRRQQATDPTLWDASVVTSYILLMGGIVLIFGVIGRLIELFLP